MKESFEILGLEKEDIGLLHERAKDNLAKATIDERKFLKVYGEAEVEADLAEVRRREKSFGRNETEFSRENKKLADIFEALVVQNGELNDWFGENATTLKTSKYDDYVNGVDMVVEFREEGEEDLVSYLGLAMDVTFTTDTTTKFERQFAQIEKGDLSTVKYLDPKFAGAPGLSHMPTVIVGAHRSTLMEVAEVWLARKNSILAKHRLQVMILMQIKAQLETFGEYAHSIGRSDVALEYEDRLFLVNQILEKKQDLVLRYGNSLSDDSVHKQIMDFMNIRLSMSKAA